MLPGTLLWGESTACVCMSEIGLTLYLSSDREKELGLPGFLGDDGDGSNLLMKKENTGDPVPVWKALSQN